MERKGIRVGGIIHARGLALIGIVAGPDRPGIIAAVFRALGEAGLNAQFIVQRVDLNNDTHVQFCVAAEDRERVLEALRPVAERLDAQRLTEGRRVALLSIYGPDFRERPGIAGEAFGALAECGVNILAVSTSISTISCVVEEDQGEKALDMLHRVFVLP